jgi:hypothetical protein
MHTQEESTYPLIDGYVDDSSEVAGHTSSLVEGGELRGKLGIVVVVVRG